MSVESTCLHCKTRYANRPHGLCTSCYMNTAVRCRYPLRKTGRRFDYEPTEEELNAIIAEQLQSPLPEWWQRAVTQQDNEDHDEDEIRCRVVGNYYVW